MKSPEHDKAIEELVRHLHSEWRPVPEGAKYEQLFGALKCADGFLFAFIGPTGVANIVPVRFEAMKDLLKCGYEMLADKTLPEDYQFEVDLGEGILFSRAGLLSFLIGFEKQLPHAVA